MTGGGSRLDKAPDAHYRLILLDAFSSDAVPVHLLTREAPSGGVWTDDFSNIFRALVLY